MRAMDCDPRYFSTMLENIASFVEIVYFQGYTSELLACKIFFGSMHTRPMITFSTQTVAIGSEF